MLKLWQTVWRREKLSPLMEIMSFPLPQSFNFLSLLLIMLLPLSSTILCRPSLPHLLLLSLLPTSFLLTRSLHQGSLPLFQLLPPNLSLTKLLLPQPPLPWLPLFLLLLLLSLLQANSMLRMSLDSSALDIRISTQPRLKPRMPLE